MDFPPAGSSHLKELDTDIRSLNFFSSMPTVQKWCWNVATPQEFLVLVSINVPPLLTKLTSFGSSWLSKIYTISDYVKLLTGVYILVLEQGTLNRANFESLIHNDSLSVKYWVRVGLWTTPMSGLDGCSIYDTPPQSLTFCLSIYVQAMLLPFTR